MFHCRADFGFLLNGRQIVVRGIAPQATLLNFVRSRGLTGAKEGCAEGECGACAVLLVAERATRAVYHAVNSCLIPLPAVAGREVITVEGLACDGRIADAQTAMIEHGGSQCGYCTPGFVVSMFAEQHSGNTVRDPHRLGGNLCRCTGYRPIADAFRSLPKVPAGPLRNPAALKALHLKALHYKALQLKAMHYATGDGRFSRPVSLAECFALMESDADARFVAGNTDSGVETNLRDRRFPHLVSLEAIEELRQFNDGPDCIEIGAALTLTEIEDRWRDAPPVFREWLSLFASPLIRNRATLGGNLATASPIGDAAPLLLALDAQIVMASAGGARTVPLDEFFLAYRRTVLARGEVLKSIRIPKPFPALAKFYKVAKRRMDDISTVAAGIAFTRDAAGTIVKARVAYGGVAAIPRRAREAEEAIVGAIPGTTGGAAALEHACSQLRRTLTPIGDHRGSAAYRLAMAQNLLEKALIA
jgi:xanthine dehydrogenase small subunit